MKGSVQITYVDSKLEKYDNGYELLMNFDDMQKVYDAPPWVFRALKWSKKCF